MRRVSLCNRFKNMCNLIKLNIVSFCPFNNYKQKSPHEMSYLKEGTNKTFRCREGGRAIYWRFSIVRKKDSGKDRVDPSLKKINKKIKFLRILY